MHKKSASRDKILQQNEGYLNTECTFAPNISSSYQFNFDKPVYKRLYDDSKRRLKNKNLLQKRKEDLWDSLHLLTSSSTSANFDNLYQDYKSKQKNISELRKKYDQENLPFKPKINENFPVKTCFSERNYKLFEKKTNAERKIKVSLPFKKRRYNKY